MTTLLSPQFVASTLALLSGCAGLGAAGMLWLLHRTRQLQLMLGFLLSLVLIGLGFWIPLLGPGETLALIFQVPGIVLNIMVVPSLTMSLLSLETRPWHRAAHLAWGGLAVTAALLYLLLPGLDLMGVWVSIQLLLTIGASIVLMVVKTPSLLDRELRKALRVFQAMSAVFVVFLGADITISRLELPGFAMVDNLSLPLYQLALTLACVHFARVFLSRGPLVEEGKLSRACIDQFGLTAREVDMVEGLMRGSSNQDLADALFVSRKTVENHLYNIYRKMKVRSRMQLVRLLQDQERA